MAFKRKLKRGLRYKMCRECVKECIGDVPCKSCKNGVEVELSMPIWIVAGLITLLVYFMLR